MPLRLKLCNGSVVEVDDDRHTVVILSDGTTICGCPQGSAEQAETAHDLGYGDDVAAMVAEHDPLHAILCAWLGLPTSYALSAPGTELAHHEEAAVIAVQRFMRRAGGKLPIP